MKIGSARKVWLASVLERRQAERRRREGMELRGDPLGTILRWAVYAALIIAVVSYFTDPASRQEVDGFLSGAWQMLVDAWNYSKA